MSTPVVMITGALTRIGRATALAFAHEGARIVVSGRRAETGKALATELRTLGVEADVPAGPTTRFTKTRRKACVTVAPTARV